MVLMVFAVGVNAYGQDTAEPATEAATAPLKTREQVIGEIEKLGGKVRVDAQAAGKPVIAMDFKGLPVTDADMGLLEGLGQLRTLDLMNTPVTDAGLAHLKGLSQLQTLDLRNTKITDDGLDQLKGLSHLKTLELIGSKAIDGALSHPIPPGQVPVPAQNVPKAVNAAPAPPQAPVPAAKPNAGIPGVIGQLFHSPMIIFFVMFAGVIMLIVGVRIAVAMKLVPAPTRGGLQGVMQVQQSMAGITRGWRWVAGI